MSSHVDTPAFWDEQYKNGLAGKFLKPCEMLVPGCGKGYDAVEAAKAGYSVTAVDFSSAALNSARALAGKENVNIDFIEDDIFSLDEIYKEKFGAVYEYTTFCAVNPSRREEYLAKLSAYLRKDGVLAALLFPVEKRDGGPPFGIDAKEFFKSASKYFDLLFSSKQINSIKPRRGREVLQVYLKK